VSFGPVPQGQRWLITRIAIKTNSTGTPTFEFFTTPNAGVTPPDIDLADYTAVGNEDIADDVKDLVRSGEYATARWAGASAGSTGTVAIQFERYARRGKIERRLPIA